MTEAEQFAIVDAYDGNTMIVFSDIQIAMRYAQHLVENHGQTGLVVGAEDTREGTGLYVMWREPVPPNKVEERLANCQWLLEAVLSGKYPRPRPGEVNALWAGGRRDN